MPFGGLLSLAPALLGVGSSLFGLAQGTPASNVPTFNYGNTSGADQGAFSGIGNLGGYNVAGNVLPQYQSIAQSLVGNPYGQGFINNSANIGQTGMGAGQAFTGAGLSSINPAQQLIGSSLSTLPGVQSLLQMGFDPQNALYSQLQNQNQQQNLATLGQSGVAGTPYGQGVANQANTNFNIDWQNNLLQRAAQGAGAAGNLLGSAAGGVGSGFNTLGQGAGLTNTGLNMMQTGAGLPYNAFQTVGGNQLASLGQLGQFGQTASQIPQTQISDYLQYLSQATGQQNANVNQANASFQQSNQLGQNLGNSLGQLGKAFGGGQSLFGSGNNLGNFSTFQAPGYSFPMAV